MDRHVILVRRVEGNLTNLAVPPAVLFNTSDGNLHAFEDGRLGGVSGAISEEWVEIKI